MKKILLILFSIFLIYIFSSNTNINTEPVFNEQDYIENYDHDYFYVTSSKIDLNTNNIEDYFNDYDIKIIGLFPKLNKIYDEKLEKKLNYYSFNNLYDNRTYINNFTNNYVGLLKNNNYIDMANLVYFNGIDIDKILIYTSYNSIYRHDLNYKLFNYKVREF